MGHSELGSILQLLYYGETRVRAGRINQFFSKARDLKIKIVAEGLVTAIENEQGSKDSALSTNMGMISITHVKDEVPTEDTGEETLEHEIIANNDVTSGPELNRLSHKCEKCSSEFTIKRNLLSGIPTAFSDPQFFNSLQTCLYHLLGPGLSPMEHLLYRCEG